MTLTSTPETLEQLIHSAITSRDYNPVWARFVRTRFFAPIRTLPQSASAQLHVQPGQKDGQPLLLVTQEREKLISSNADAHLLSGADIVKQLAPGVAIGLVLGKDIFTIPAKLVDAMRSKLEVATAGGQKTQRPLNVQALNPRHVAHPTMGMELHAPADWQQRINPRSLVFFDTASGAKIEGSSMPQRDLTLAGWLETRLPAVTKELPFLKQLGPSRPITAPKWQGKISAMVTEFQGIMQPGHAPTHYLICCYRSETMVATLSIRVQSAALEKYRALYQWLFEQVDLFEPASAPEKTGSPARVESPSQADDASNRPIAPVDAPPLLALGLSGRLGRLRFIAYSALIYVPTLLFSFLLIFLPTMLTMAIGGTLLIAAIWLTTRLIVLRLHDFNQSGHWVWPVYLLIGIDKVTEHSLYSWPVSAVLYLVLFLIVAIPGNRRENKHGAPSGPEPIWVKGLAAAFVAVQFIMLAQVLTLKYTHGGPFMIPT